MTTLFPLLTADLAGAPEPGDRMTAGNGSAPLRSFALIGTAYPINAFLMSTVACLTRFFLTQPAALSRRSGVSKGLALSPVAMTGAAAMLAGSFLPWGIPVRRPGGASSAEVWRHCSPRCAQVRACRV